MSNRTSCDGPGCAQTHGRAPTRHPWIHVENIDGAWLASPLPSPLIPDDGLDFHNLTCLRDWAISKIGSETTTRQEAR